MFRTSMKRFTIGCAGLLGVLIGSTAVAKEVSFNRDVRPILSDKCFACHGPDSNARKADLRLDLRDSALTVIEPGKIDESELIHRITASDPDEVMPPVKFHKKISKQEVGILRDWVEQGAPYESHWSFIPLAAVTPPQVQSGDVFNAIDQFVLARLQNAGLNPASQADRRTLIRRVTLDLTGLPPTPAEVDDFVNDSDPLDVAYGKVVDRLLKSARYGEHMAYSWLDAARYADSDGYESDPLRNMWPWRDWVVWALNSNMPYDRFIIEQLAGDMLPGATMRQKLATGFNRNHRLNNEGGILPEEWLVEYVADRAETTATVFMGLTWGCARCHDHKYDPISQTDYYSLFAFFHKLPEQGSARGDRNAEPMMHSPPLPKIEEYEANQKALAPLKAEQSTLAAAQQFTAQLKEWIVQLDDAQRKKLPKEIAPVAPDKWNAKQKAAARDYFLKNVHQETATLQKQIAVWEKRQAALLKAGAKVMVMADMAQPRKTHVLIRGAYDRPGEEVAAETPSWLPPMKKSAPRNRLGLAQWLVDPQHPLTARVAVNRIWTHHFGAGLVKTPEDFGSQGESPSHPALLDYLAASFIESGWDVKGLHKLIVMSRSYRQSSGMSQELLARDPENRLLARGPRERLAAAVIRDQALFLGGLLVEEMGGPAVKPYQPDGLWREIIKGGPTYKRDTGSKLYRRSLYSLWRRAVKPPLMMLLDANERDTCRVSQKRTNTPLQALLLLNDVVFVEAARGMGSRMMLEGGTTEPERITWGMRLATSRPPTSEELKILQEELTSYRQSFQANAVAAKALVNIGESKPNETLAVDELAAYTALARLLLNLDETITKE